MTTKTEKFKPTKDMLSAAKSVLTCMAAVETIKPIVEGYQREILAYEKYEYSEKASKRRGKTPVDWIKEPSESWLMSDQDFKHYNNKCNEERIKAKLHVDNEDFCPLLVAKNLLNKAENLLIKTMEPITGLSNHDVLLSNNGLENRKKLIDLTLRLLTPFVKMKV